MPDRDALDAAPDPEVVPGQVPGQTDVAAGDAAPEDPVEGNGDAGNPGAMPTADAPGPNPDQPPPSPVTLPSAPVAAAPVQQPAPRVNDAMRVISRMQTDLDVATGGKRPATHEEVDAAFHDTIKALGIRLPPQAADTGIPATIAQTTPIAPPEPGSRGIEKAGVSWSRATAALARTDGESPDIRAVADADGAATGPERESGMPVEELASVDPVRAPRRPTGVNNTSSASGAAPVATRKRLGKKGAGAAPRPPIPWPSLPDQRLVPLVRQWPVPGWPDPKVHRFPLDGQKGTNHLTFADGRYAPEGGFRGYKGKDLRKHKGDDLPGTIGDPVGAAADGTISSVGTAEGYGKYVAIKHADGFTSVYGHLDSWGKVKLGQAVTGGTVVGTMGNTGWAKGKGTHLHFEVKVTNGQFTLDKRNRTVDPEKWLNGEIHEP